MSLRERLAQSGQERAAGADLFDAAAHAYQELKFCERIHQSLNCKGTC